MAKSLATSSPPPLIPYVTSSRTFSASVFIHFKVRNGVRRLALVPSVRCSSDDMENQATLTPPPPPPRKEGPPSYTWSALIGGVGLVETAYLTYVKVTSSDPFCSVGGGSCGDVLNSDYASVFGIPLPLIGMIAYGMVATVSLKLNEKSMPFGLGESDGRAILLGITTSMAASSAYFLYILTTKLAGASCAYCLLSAFLSFSLFFLSVKDYGFEEIRKTLGLQLAVAGLVLFTLSSAYGSSQSIPSSLAEADIPFFMTEVTTPSRSYAIALAKHLHSIGAKMYGAFWCSHCLEQKQMFGQEAAKILDYVECFPNGYKKGIKLEKACTDVGIEGFPTWVINGEVLSGEKELSELAEISGFQSKEK
ncbi:hypothetical protein MLD38_015579 [Melastoma candidum]|uniref:Uncharacterized protein n=1 Tax=Melastoma candidum TaxID=119954 RepID=A0ACB9RQ05_9MYRT|nr:hypothetical protein MLD38_015579 [Melastoma candidum]